MLCQVLPGWTQPHVAGRYYTTGGEETKMKPNYQDLKELDESGHFYKGSPDIPTTYFMTDKCYKEFIESNRLFYLDHHDILRYSITGAPIATSRKQIEMLIAKLHVFKAQMG